MPTTQDYCDASSNNSDPPTDQNAGSQEDAAAKTVLQKFRAGQLLARMKPLNQFDDIPSENLTEIMERTNAPATGTAEQLVEWNRTGRMYPLLDASLIRPELKGSILWYRFGLLFDLQHCETMAAGAQDLASDDNGGSLMKTPGRSQAEGLVQLAKFCVERQKEMSVIENCSSFVPRTCNIQDIDPEFATERSALHDLAEKNPLAVKILTGLPSERNSQAAAAVTQDYQKRLQQRIHLATDGFQGTHTEFDVNCSIDALLGGVVTTRGYQGSLANGTESPEWQDEIAYVRRFLQSASRLVPQLEGRPLVLAQYVPGGGVAMNPPDARGCWNSFVGDNCRSPEDLPEASLKILEVIGGHSDVSGDSVVSKSHGRQIMFWVMAACQAVCFMMF
jgi:hypothetical protein